MKKAVSLFAFVSIVFLCVSNLFGQSKDIEIGTQNTGLQNRQGGYYDYSDPMALNIKVSVWGFVKFPGRYNVPINTTVSDLMSYAGGPTDDATLDDVRLYKVDENGEQSLIKINYDDLLWGEQLVSEKKIVPKLEAGDILLVTGNQRLYMKEWLQLTLSIISTLISLTILFTR